jgi:nitrogen regulatory protein P-II 2
MPTGWAPARPRIVRIRLISDLFVYTLRRDIPASECVTVRQDTESQPGACRPMKLVTAIIKPFKLEDVRDALTKIGVNGMTVTEVKGYGRQKGHTEIYRGAEYAVNFLPKLRIEIGVTSDRANAVVEAIAGSAKTGQIGDGKIFVQEIDKAVRIRTGETDTDAL